MPLSLSEELSAKKSILWTGFLDKMRTLRRHVPRREIKSFSAFVHWTCQVPSWVPFILAIISCTLLATRAVVGSEKLLVPSSNWTAERTVRGVKSLVYDWRGKVVSQVIGGKESIRDAKVLRKRQRQSRRRRRMNTSIRMGDISARANDAEFLKNGTGASVRDAQAYRHVPSRLFGHFDVDNDGLLSEKEVAALLKMLTRKNKEEAERKAKDAKRHAPGVPERPSGGTHDISIDGETLVVGDGDFDLLFKQLSNLKQTKDPSKDPRMTLQEDIVFVKDLVIVFFAATVGGVLAINFNQPALIGFLAGGMMVGPGGLSIVTELVEIETLASLGIAFLLFSIGVEFSFTELQSVKKIAILGGFLSMFAVVVGSGGLALLLSLVDSFPQAVALGLALSLSSTAVVMQCLPSSPNSHSHGPHDGSRPSPRLANVGSPLSPSVGWTGSPGNSSPASQSFDTLNGQISKQDGLSFESPRSRKVMVGLLVFQDVMIGLILALLPTLKGSAGQIFEELVSSALRLGCFVVLSLAVAEFILPTLIDRLDKAGSSEVFTLGCVVFCLAAAYLSEQFGLAIELGAFAAGMMLSESRHKEKVERAISTVRDVFTAIFFISIGMMIHWRYFYQNSLKMAILVIVIIVVKTLAMGSAMFLLGGLPLRTAMACGATLSQAGEFTFVVASKGLSLLLFSPSETRMILGATAITMLITPYLVKYAKMTVPKSLSPLESI